jgi:putative ABC transport system substrate-binding protein
MRRREFITLLGGAAVAWPLVARAQQTDRMKQIGVLIPYAESDPVGQARVTALKRGMQELGWTEGGNVRIDVRWAEGIDRMRAYAGELLRLAQDGKDTAEAVAEANRYSGRA